MWSFDFSLASRFILDNSLVKLTGGLRVLHWFFSACLTCTGSEHRFDLVASSIQPLPTAYKGLASSTSKQKFRTISLRKNTWHNGMGGQITVISIQTFWMAGWEKLVFQTLCWLCETKRDRGRDSQPCPRPRLNSPTTGGHQRENSGAFPTSRQKLINNRAWQCSTSRADGIDVTSPCEYLRFEGQDLFRKKARHICVLLNFWSRPVPTLSGSNGSLNPCMFKFWSSAAIFFEIFIIRSKEANIPQPFC